MEETTLQFPTDLKEILQRANEIEAVKYNKTRNYLDGAVNHISPYVTHGVLDLVELKNIAISKFGEELSEGFISQLLWREYFQRVWQEKNVLENLRFEQQNVKHENVPEKLINSKTEISVLDKAINGLYQHGYIHNHARMWIAALTCNFAHYHWKKPALWMYYHLLDGDVASNMLSWQWVAGTSRNKTYIMNQGNINKFSKFYEETYLSKSYEKLEKFDCSENFNSTKFSEDISHFEKLNKEFPTISQDEKTFLLSMWSLDPRKIDEDCKNIILVIEPSFIKKLPMSKKRLEFIQSLSKNIKNINIVYNEINNLPEGNYIHFEHPSTNHWPGEKRERTWLYPEKKGFFKSYFQYRKSLEKI